MFTSRIEKHHHTKRGFDFFIVVLSERVDAETFNKLRGQCQVAGGWYSRQWGPTPGGFAFMAEEAAEAFAEAIGGKPTESNGKPKQAKKTEQVKKAKLAKKASV